MKHFLLLAACSLAAFAGLIKAPEKAIADLYPKGSFAKKTILLSSDEAARVEALAQEKLDSKIVTYYEITTPEGPVYAYVQTVRVRSKNLAAMTFVEGSGTIRAIEIIAMFEPMEYLPPQKWLETLEKKSLADPIRPKRDIPAITGATLSANAVSKSARTALAIHSVKVAKP